MPISSQYSDYVSNDFTHAVHHFNSPNASHVPRPVTGTANAFPMVSANAPARAIFLSLMVTPLAILFPTASKYSEQSQTR